MITGYYIRGSAEGAWALVEQDGRYDERVVVDGLTNKEAVALYWRMMAELHAPNGEAGIKRAKAEPDRRPQLSLPL